MRSRFAVILPVLVIAAVPAGTAAQSTASAPIRVTVRPGSCPVHSRCDDHPGKGPKPKETRDTRAAASDAADPLAVLDVGSLADVQPSRITIRSRGGGRSPTSARPSGELPLRLWHGVLQETGAGGVWLYGLLRSPPPQGTYGGLITIIVEY